MGTLMKFADNRNTKMTHVVRGEEVVNLRLQFAASSLRTALYQLFACMEQQYARL